MQEKIRPIAAFLMEILAHVNWSPPKTFMLALHMVKDGYDTVEKVSLVDEADLGRWGMSQKIEKVIILASKGTWPMSAQAEQQRELKRIADQLEILREELQAVKQNLK